MTTLFISHSSSDNEFAGVLRERLTENGYTSLFLDFHPEDGIGGGQKWEPRLYRELRNCDALLFVCSDDSVQSKWCFAELALARSIGRPAVQLVLERTARRELFRDTNYIDFSKWQESDQAFSKLWRDLDDLGLGPESSFSWQPGDCPYPGLAPLDDSHAGVFFGRDSEIERLQALLARTLERGSARFLPVIGASGTGKSSLVRAGLLPRLAKKKHWLVLQPRVRGSALREIARSFLQAFERQGTKPEGGGVALRKRIENGDLAAISEDLLMDAAPETEAVLLFVDQLEELLIARREIAASGGESDRASAGSRADSELLDLLAAGVGDAEAPLAILATMRSEFLPELAAVSGLTALASQQPFVLGPLAGHSLLEVIERPADRAGFRFEDGLARRMAAEAGGGDGLPLLAYTLRQLYERQWPDRKSWAASEDKVILSHHYEQLGGVLGTLNRSADRVLDELVRETPRDQVLEVLLGFARLDARQEPTRRRVRLRDLSASGRRVVDAFVEARLLRTSGSAGGSQPSAEATAEVAHEALLRSWPPLEAMIHASRDELLLESELEQAASSWKASGFKSSYLLRGERLAAAERFVKTRDRSMAGGEIGKLVRESKAQSQEVLERESRLLAARAHEVISEDPIRAILLARAAIEDYFHTPQAERALHSAIEASRWRAALPTDPGCSGVRYSGDGRCLLTASRTTNRAELWDVAAIESGRAQEPIRVLDHDDAVDTAFISHDGDRVATLSGGDVFLWDLDQQGPPRRIDAGGSASGLALAESPPRVATLDADTGGVLVWDWATVTTSAEGGGTDAPVARLEHGERPVRAVTFVPVWNERDSGDEIGAKDGSWLATAPEDGTVRIWSIDDCREELRLEAEDLELWPAREDEVIEALRTLGSGEGHFFHCLAVSGRGDRLLGIAIEGAVLWDLENGQALGLVGLTQQALDSDGDERGGKKPQFFGVFSPDGRTVITGLSDTAVAVWNVESRDQLFRIEHEGPVMNLAISPDGRQLASVPIASPVQIWSLRRTHSQVLIGHRDLVFRASFSADDGLIASCSRDRTLRLWDARSGAQRARLWAHRAPVLDAVFSADGSNLFSASPDGEVRRWSVAEALEKGDWRVFGPEWNDPELRERDLDPEIRAAIPAPLLQLPGECAASVLATEPCGRFLAAGCSDGFARLIDPETGRVVAEAPVSGDGEHRGVNALSWSADGMFVATVSSNGRCSVLAMPDLSETLRLDGLGWLEAVALSPDGKVLAFDGEEAIRLVDAKTGKPLRDLEGHEDSVQHLVFSSDGRHLLSASLDGTLMVWDPLAGEVRRHLAGHRDAVQRSGFSHDGSRVVSASVDGRVRIWEHLAIADLLEKARRRAGRELTKREREEAGLPQPS